MPLILHEHESKAPRLTVNCHTGIITLSPVAVRQYGLQPQQVLDLAYESDREGEWFLTPGYGKRSLSAYQNKAGQCIYRIVDRRLTQDLLRSIDFKGVSCAIPLGTATEKDGHTVIPLITRLAEPNRKAR